MKAMKNVVLILFLLFFTELNTLGQRTRTVIYDYNKQEFVEEDGTPSKTNSWVNQKDFDFVLLKIRNANGMALKITINSEAKTVDPEDSGISILDALLGDIAPEVSGSETTQEIDSGVGISATEKMKEVKNELFSSLNAKLSDYQMALNQLKQVSDLEVFLHDAIVRGATSSLSINSGTAYKGNSFSSYYLEFAALMNRIRDNKNKLEAELAKEKSDLTDAEKLELTKAVNMLSKDYDEEEFIKKIDSFLNKVRRYNLNNNTFTESIAIGKADLIDFTTKVEVKEEFTNLLKVKPVPGKISLRVFGQSKINTSTGLFFATLIDHNYKVREVTNSADPDKNLEIFRENEGGFKSTGVGALVHFYRTSKHPVQVGWNLGTMLNSNGQVRYLTGPSFIFGRTNRMILNFGLAAGQVKRLGSGQIEGDLISDPQGILTKNAFKLGGFLAFTYNLTKK